MTLAEQRVPRASSCASVPLLRSVQVARSAACLRQSSEHVGAFRRRRPALCRSFKRALCGAGPARRPRPRDASARAEDAVSGSRPNDVPGRRLGNAPLFIPSQEALRTRRRRRQGHADIDDSASRRNWASTPSTSTASIVLSLLGRPAGAFHHRSLAAARCRATGTLSST